MGFHRRLGSDLFSVLVPGIARSKSVEEAGHELCLTMILLGQTP